MPVAWSQFERLNLVQEQVTDFESGLRELIAVYGNGRITLYLLKGLVMSLYEVRFEFPDHRHGVDLMWRSGSRFQSKQPGMRDCLWVPVRSC